MAIAFISAAQNSYGQSPPTLSLPGGSDILLISKASWFYAGGTPTLTGGTGTWTLVNNITSGSGETAGSIFYKLVPAASITTENAASYTFTPPGGGGDNLCCTEAWSGHDTTNPLAELGGAGVYYLNGQNPFSGGPDLSIGGGAISVAGTQLSCVFGAWNFNVWSTTPSGWTREATLGGGEESSFVYKSTTESVGTGSTITYPGATQRVVGIMIGIQPSGGGGGGGQSTVAWIRA